MRDVKRSILALTFVAAFAVLLLGAGVAQAAEWKAKGKTFEELKLTSEEVTGVSTGSIKLEVPKLSVSIKCTTGTAAGSITKGGTGTGTFEFSKCSVVNAKEEALKTCTVTEPIKFGFKATMLELEESIYSKLTPSSEESFTSIKITGAECPIPSAKVTGSTAGEFPAEENIEQSLTFSKIIGEKTGTSLMYGVNAATLTGVVLVKLSGANVKAIWGPVRPFTASPVAPDFGEVSLGMNNKILITFTFHGVVATEMMGPITITNGTENVFLKVGTSDTCAGAVLTQASPTCQIEIEFKPAMLGVRTATVKLKETGLVPRSLTITVKGKGKV
jgi:hypothetical protein